MWVHGRTFLGGGGLAVSGLLRCGAGDGGKGASARLVVTGGAGALKAPT